MKDLNRLKIVLCEKKRTSKWLSEELGKNVATVSKWCTNTAQPSLETLVEIAECLRVDIRTLLNPSETVLMASEPEPTYNKTVKSDE